MSDGLNGSEQGITIEPQLPQQAHAELLGINPTPLRTLLEETITEERKINSIDNDGYRRSKERLQPMWFVSVKNIKRKQTKKFTSKLKMKILVKI
jgi:hypothetical protein